ncbi:hypothetical protein G7Y89_g7671 [Cudoniella acicularis]|uniref:Enoyl reductase (ER) domain-containing protein n=1 Tax=Cudoniella acicularis TaxID=354080 RepID=A0A8H4RI32_9HELO|nr:hypothetical protein G7Y89_g7671 [Cudoniella acicularis]
MSKTSLQYQLSQKGGHFAIVSIPRPTPGPNEICIRMKAVALNPVDWKNRAMGITIQSWPTVLGHDGAGVVDSVGDSVKDFKVGDEVFALCGTDKGEGDRAAAFQEIAMVPSHYAAKKPAFLTFEEASSLGVCYLTAACAITVGLHIPLPYIDPTGGSSVKSILVLGGSSTVGGAAIQLLRLALPSATILATSSTKHHAHLISLGSDSKRAGFDAILDAVTAAASQPDIFSAFNPTGPKTYSQVVTGVNVEVPQGVDSTLIYAPQIFGEKGGMNAMPGLTDLLQSGKFKLPVKVEVVGKGFDAIEHGLDKLMKGVSGANF